MMRDQQRCAKARSGRIFVVDERWLSETGEWRYLSKFIKYQV
jgi:hypothetical protein